MMTHEQAKELWWLIDRYVDACCEEVDLGGYLGMDEERVATFNRLNSFIDILKDKE